MSEICHGCQGKGWIQVIDPPAVVKDVGSGTTDSYMQPISQGTARAQVCPICKGEGTKKND